MKPEFDFAEVADQVAMTGEIKQADSTSQDNVDALVEAFGDEGALERTVVTRRPARRPRPRRPAGVRRCLRAFGRHLSSEASTA